MVGTRTQSALSWTLWEALSALLGNLNNEVRN
jgi:hypothetical protein